MNRLLIFVGTVIVIGTVCWLASHITTPPPDVLPAATTVSKWMIQPIIEEAGNKTVRYQIGFRDDGIVCWRKVMVTDK